MAREGKKIEEFDIWTETGHGTRDQRYSAVLRMREGFKFTLEVGGLSFEGKNPSDLIHQARMQLEDERELSWDPIILVDPDIQEGRLVFKRLFHAKTKKGKDVWRLWRFDGEDEHPRSKYNVDDIKTFERLEGATPGGRNEGPLLKHRELPYTAERWTAILKLDEMLGEAQKTVARRIRELIREGDLDGFLAKASTARIVFEEGKA